MKRLEKFNLRLEEMKEFVRINSRYPKSNEGSLGNWRGRMRYEASESQRKEILKVFPDFFDESIIKRLEEMKEFVKVNRRYPKQSEGSLGWWRNNMRCKATEDQRMEILKVFPDFFDEYDIFNERLKEMKEFVRINSRYPKSNEGSLGNWRGRMRSKATEHQRREILSIFPDFFDK